MKCWQGSVYDSNILKKIIKQSRPQFIFHLAGFGIRPGQNSFLRSAEVNIYGLINLLSSLEKLDYERFVYSGTSAEYGPSSVAMAENQMLNPVTFYGATKAAGTLITQAFSQVYCKKAAVLRPFYVYGPDEGPARFVSTVIRRGVSGRELKLTSLSEKRDFIYVEDVIDAYLLAAVKDIKVHTILNIGTGKEHCLKDVIEIVERKIGKRIKVKEGVYPCRPWKSGCWAADISKAQKVLGWKPAHTLSVGIDKTIEWIKSASN